MDTTVKTAKKKNSNLRHWFQAASVALSNGYAYGWAKGKIYTGSNKQFCLPGLNCYSCPGAVGACPIGALQAVLDSGTYKFSLYVFGCIGLLGMLFGRFICGWMCPFGFFQDLLYKIPFFKKMKNLPGHKYAIYLKYVILLLFVIILPMTVLNVGGVGAPWFCEYICPSGMLLGGIPLTAANPNLAAQIGPRFMWKLAVLILFTVLSILSYRPFCKYVCPLGALYGFCNPVSGYRLRVNEEKCVSCAQCQKACGMDIKVWQNPNSMECIRCGKCLRVCPTGAITTTWGDLRRSLSQPDPQPVESVAPDYLQPVGSAAPNAAAVAPNADETALAVKTEAEKPAKKKGSNFWRPLIGILMFITGLYLIGKKATTIVSTLVFGLVPEDVLTLWALGSYIIPLVCAVLLFILSLKMISGKNDIRLTHQLNWITLGSVPFVVAVYFVFGLFAYGASGMNPLLAFNNAVYLITDDWKSYLVLIILTLLGAFATKRTDRQ